MSGAGADWLTAAQFEIRPAQLRADLFRITRACGPWWDDNC